MRKIMKIRDQKNGKKINHIFKQTSKNEVGIFNHKPKEKFSARNPLILDTE